MDLFAVAEGMNTLGFPLLAILAMFASKLSVGPATRLTDRFFIFAFALQTILTARTVVNCDHTWLLHMFTVMILIVGSVIIPSLRDNVAEPV